MLNTKWNKELHIKDSKLGKVLQTNQFYEWSLIILVLSSFIAWLTGLFINGEASRQMELFFQSLNDFLADCLNVIGYSSERDVYDCMRYSGLGEKAYPPLTYMILYLFSRLVDMQKYYQADYFLTMYQEKLLLIVLIIMIIIIFITIYEIIRSNKTGSDTTKRLFAISMVLSYPMLYTLERGNTLLVTLIFVMYYLFHYDSENKVKREFSLISLALAIAFKATPVILVLLLVANKKWKEIIRAFIYGIITGIGPFFFFDGGLTNITKMIRNLILNGEIYSSTSGCTLLATLINLGIPYSQTFEIVCTILTYIICFIFFISLPTMTQKWEKVLAVVMILLIFPSHSGSYCIIYLIPVCILFLSENTHTFKELFVLAAFMLMLYDFQSRLGYLLLNYHWTILIFTIYMLWQCVQNILHLLVRNG